MVDGTDFVWSDAIGICGFCNGSCRENGCGAGMCVSDVHTRSRVAWHTVHKTCEPVLRGEFSGC